MNPGTDICRLRILLIMNSAEHPLKDTWNILHSLMSAVFLILLLEIPSISILLPAGIFKSLFPFIFLSLLPLKIIIYSGIYGCFAVLCSGKEYLVSRPLIIEQIKRTWLLFTFFQIFLLGIQFCSFVFLPRMDYAYWTVFLEPVCLIFLTLLIIARYFLKTSPGKLLSLPLPLKTVVQILLIILINISCAVLLKQEPQIHALLTLSLIFIVKYTHLFLFVYLCLLFFSKTDYFSRNPPPEKELFLINPLGGGSVIEVLTSIFLRFYPPVFVVLSALTPKNYSVRSFSRVFWQSSYFRPGKLVAITCFTSNCFEAYRIAKGFRQKGSTVIMGGPHVSFVPHEALEFCDAVVVGEVESVWEEVVRDHENNSLKKMYQGGAASQAVRDRIYNELLNASPDIIRYYLEASYGCKFHCSFCCISALCQGRFGHRTVEQVVRILERVRTKYTTVSFIDNNIYSDPAYAKQLFTALKPLKMKWIANCSIDIGGNEPLLKLAKESGCQGLLIGYEITSASLEKSQGGKFALADKFIEYTKRIKKAGIHIEGHFIIGFDSDRIKNIFKYWLCCFRIFPDWTAVSLLTPLPGTQLYKDMLQQERMLSLNWRNFSCYWPVFQTKHFTHASISILHPVIFFAFLFTTCKWGLAILFVLILSFWGAYLF